MKILLGNPNTSPEVTARITAAARAVASPGTEIKPATGHFGALIISTRVDMAIAEHASLDMMTSEAADCDAAIIGASIDSGLRAVRQALPIPVLGLTEAALHVACLTAGRFGLVVMGPGSATITREMVAAYGLADRLAGIRWITAAPANLLADQQSLIAPIAATGRRLIDEDLAETVILIGAVMAGMPAFVQPHVPVPVIEGVSCAVALAESLVRLNLPRPTQGSYAKPA